MGRAQGTLPCALARGPSPAPIKFFVPGMGMVTISTLVLGFGFPLHDLFRLDKVSHIAIILLSTQKFGSSK